MTIHQPIAAEGGATPVGEPSKTPQPAPALRLVRATAASWTHEMIMEAVRNGYEVAFSFEDGFVTASFWNHEYHCYSREWTP